jgi:hypothetical protein
LVFVFIFNFLDGGSIFISGSASLLIDSSVKFQNSSSKNGSNLFIYLLFLCLFFFILLLDGGAVYFSNTIQSSSVVIKSSFLDCAASLSGFIFF